MKGKRFLLPLITAHNKIINPLINMMLWETWQQFQNCITKSSILTIEILHMHFLRKIAKPIHYVN